MSEFFVEERKRNIKGKKGTSKGGCSKGKGGPKLSGRNENKGTGGQIEKAGGKKKRMGDRSPGGKGKRGLKGRVSGDREEFGGDKRGGEEGGEFEYDRGYCRVIKNKKEGTPKKKRFRVEKGQGRAEGGLGGM